MTKNQYKLSGAKLRKIRKDRGLTLEQVALAVGMDFSNLSKIERGKRPFTITSAIRLGNVLGVVYNQFFKPL